MSQDKEREAFETQTFFDTEDNDPDVHRNPDGTYVNYYVQLAWQGWQARAALASQQAAPSAGEVEREALIERGRKLADTLETWYGPKGHALTVRQLVSALSHKEQP